MTTTSANPTGQQAEESAATGKPPVAEFDELAEQASSGEEVDLDEVGRTNMTIRDLLRLNQGSVVELDRPADEPMDVLVNGTLVAHAEIVVVDDMFGIRLIDVVSPSERIRKLK